MNSPVRLCCTLVTLLHPNDEMPVSGPGARSSVHWPIHSRLAMYEPKDEDYIIQLVSLSKASRSTELTWTVRILRRLQLNEACELL